MISKLSKVVPFVSLLLVTFIVPNARAEEEFADLLKRSQELKDQGKFAQAINELSWASEQLQKLHIEKLKSFFPGKVSGMQPGEFKSGNTMGLLNIERPYITSTGTKLKLSLMGSGSTQGATARGIGSLAGFAQMAAAMNPEGGAERVRIKDRSAQILDERGKLNLTMSLDGGLILSVRQEKGTATKEELVAVAEAMKLDELKSYLATQ